MKRIGMTCWVGLVVVLLCAPMVPAANYVWMGTVDDNWLTDGNWRDISGVPGSADVVYTAAAGAYPFYLAGTAHIFEAQMATVTDTPVAFELRDGANLKIERHFKAATVDNSTAAITQTGGELHISAGSPTTGFTLSLAENAGATASYAMSGGLITVLNNATFGGIFVGHSGTATFTHSDGVISNNASLNLGHTSSGNGTYTISGGELEVDLNLRVGNNASTGLFKVLGSAATISVGHYQHLSSNAGLQLQLDASGISPITVSGDVTLNGDLTVAVGSFHPVGVGSMVLMSYGGNLSGSFATTSLPEGYSLEHDSTEKQLLLNYIPEPQAALLLLLGAGLLRGCRWCRRRA